MASWCLCVPCTGALAKPLHALHAACQALLSKHYASAAAPCCTPAQHRRPGLLLPCLVLPSIVKLGMLRWVHVHCVVAATGTVAAAAAVSGASGGRGQFINQLTHPESKGSQKP